MPKTSTNLAMLVNIKKKLADKFFGWYGEIFKDSALTAKEKSLIALAVAHAVQCPYCINANSSNAYEKGWSENQLMEAVHVEQQALKVVPHWCMAYK